MQLDLSLRADAVAARDLSVADFHRHYHRPQRPVVLRDLLGTLPAGRTWSLDWFKRTMGDVQVGLVDNRIQTTHRTAITEPDRWMRLGDYLDLIATDEPTPLRLFLANLFKLRPELRDDFPCPAYVDGPLRHLGYMFMGGKDSVVRFHFDIDHSCVLLTQVFGRKRVVLFPPSCSALLYKLPLGTFANVDLDAPDFERHPALAYVRGYELFLEPGDAVYMPSGYWHHITYLTGGMGVSYRTLSPRPTDWLKGLLHVGLYLPADKTMHRLRGDRWYAAKERRMHRNADRAMQRARRERSVAVAGG